MDASLKIQRLLDFDQCMNTDYFTSAIYIWRTRNATISIHATDIADTAKISIDSLSNFSEEVLDTLIVSCGLTFETIDLVVEANARELQRRISYTKKGLEAAECCFRTLGFIFQLHPVTDKGTRKSPGPFCNEPDYCKLFSVSTFYEMVKQFEFACKVFKKVRFEPKHLLDIGSVDPLQQAFYQLLGQCERGERFASRRSDIIDAYTSLQSVTIPKIKPNLHDWSILYQTQSTPHSFMGNVSISTPHENVKRTLDILFAQGYTLENIADYRVSN